MNILFTICGRSGSKGVKNKNCKDFLGVPLINYTLAAITLYQEQQTGDIIYVCLNTDSEELIALTHKQYPNIDIVPRDSKLAGDNVAKLPVIQDSLRQMEVIRNTHYDCVVDLDITSPLRTVQYIKEAIEKRQSGDYDVVFSVTEARRNPYFNMVKLNSDGSCEKVIQSNYTARQQAPALFDMNASIYAYDPEFLKTNTSGLLFDGKCSFIEMPDTGILDIDSERDFFMLEAIATHIATHDKNFTIVVKEAKKETNNE